MNLEVIIPRFVYFSVLLLFGKVILAEKPRFICELFQSMLRGMKLSVSNTAEYLRHRLYIAILNQHNARKPSTFYLASATRVIERHLR